MNIHVQFVVHAFINLVKVRVPFDDADEASRVASGLRAAGFTVALRRETASTTTEEVEI